MSIAQIIFIAETIAMVMSIFFALMTCAMEEYNRLEHAKEVFIMIQLGAHAAYAAVILVMLFIPLWARLYEWLS